jgi:uncharacterized membrane protein
MNTVFKLYFQSWLLLCLSAPWCLARMLDARRVTENARWVTVATCGALLLASCAYPVGITVTRLTYRPIPPTIDGTEYLEREHPEDFAAIAWLRNNVSGLPVILEATGNPYSYYARFSSNVGLPTVMGWANHEGLWRDHEEEVGRRRNDVVRMYGAPTLAEVQPLLDQYRIKYVAVGELERKDHPAQGLAKFTELKEVFRRGNTAIYER